MHLLILGLVGGIAVPTPDTAMAALQPFGSLIGSWKATGYPEGPKDDPANRFWSEKITVQWRIRGNDAWLTFAFESGKHFSTGELHYDTQRALYRFVLTTTDRQSWTFTTAWVPTKPEEVPSLLLSRVDPESGGSQRIGLRLLHANRILYWFETKPANRATFTQRYKVGATKEGVPFADVPKGPVCIVSGGEAKIPVMHKGKTYYVCCSGCREAFQDDPEKYVRPYEAKQKK